MEGDCGVAKMEVAARIYLREFAELPSSWPLRVLGRPRQGVSAPFLTTEFLGFQDRIPEFRGFQDGIPQVPGHMSAVETGQMFSGETGQMSAVPESSGFAWACGA